MRKIVLLLLASLFLLPLSAREVEAPRTISQAEMAAIQQRVSDSMDALTLQEFDKEAFKDEIVNEVLTTLDITYLIDKEPMMEKGFFFDAFAHATLLRGTDFVPGGTLAFGYRSGVSLYSLYGRFDYFLSPLGSDTGRMATLEVAVEPGLSFEYVVMSQDWQELKLSVDFGYYMQLIERPDAATVFFLSNNGLMIRPTISVKANLYLFRIELGLYYQCAVFPRYSDYDGFGLYLKLF